MKLAVLNSEGIADRKSLHDALASQLAFPDYYGANLDALHDLLSAESETTCIVIEGEAELKAALGDYYTKLIRVLDDLSEENGSFSYVIEKESDGHDNEIWNSSEYGD